jgi:transcriptional regulator with XRE-family HTH domain
MHSRYLFQLSDNPLEGYRRFVLACEQEVSMAKRGYNPGLGAKVKELRESRGWTQGELAERAGLSRSYLCTLEGGKVGNPSGSVMTGLATALGVDIEVLNKAAGYPTPKHLRRPKDPLDEILELNEDDVITPEDKALILSMIRSYRDSKRAQRKAKT